MPGAGLDGPLSAARLEAACGRPVVLFERCGSTNTEAAALASRGAPHGTVVVAEAQDAGRGRLGRSWVGEPGQSLLFSIVLRPALPPARAPLICLGAAVAVAEALDLRIKWPNDVLDATGRKVAGILAELHSVQNLCVILGVGVNVGQADFGPDLPQAGSLRQLGWRVDRAALLGELVHGVEARAAQLEHDPQGLLDAWRARAATLGARVRVGALEGVAEDVREDGALLVRTPAGLEPVLAGDVELLGRV